MANEKKPNEICLVGYSYTIPTSGLTDTLKIVDKFGKKPIVKSIIVEEGLSTVKMTMGRVGGGEPKIENVALSVLKQERPVPVCFEGGDYKLTFASTATASVTVNLSLIIEYV